MEQLKVASIEIEEGVRATATLVEPVISVPAHLLQAQGHILVDSDGFAFLYMLEAREMYYALRFGRDVWSNLKEVYGQAMPVYVKLDQDTELALTGLVDEIDFLLENISGNGNYGIAFEQAVQDVF